MLEDVAGIRCVVLACGTVNLRKGIDGLAMIIGDKYKQNPFEKGTIFLFCGKPSDRIKGLLGQGTGFLLLYKRLEDPHTPSYCLYPYGRKGHGSENLAGDYGTPKSGTYHESLQSCRRKTYA